MAYPVQDETDIVIVGGGVAGCIAAMSLAKFYRVLLIDKLEQAPQRIGECLAPAARRILRKLDLLEGMETWGRASTTEAHLRHTGTRSYWGSAQAHTNDPLRNPDGFGWHLNRQAFETFLRYSAAQRGVTCFWGVKLQESRYESSCWHLSLMSDTKQLSSLRCRFVIDASGRNAYFARNIGIEREQQDKLISIWATLPDMESNTMAIISADRKGWWYSASLPGGKRVLAFQTDADLIERGYIRSGSQFAQLARENSVIADLLHKVGDNIRLEGSVAANSSRLKNVCGPQWAALGDAALSFDPLSSQGMFNAMANAVQLSELLCSQDQAKVPLEQQAFELEYTQQINRVWEHYLKHKHFFYGEEKRWANDVFWKRRQK